MPMPRKVPLDGPSAAILLKPTKGLEVKGKCWTLLPTPPLLRFPPPHLADCPSELFVVLLFSSPFRCRYPLLHNQILVAKAQHTAQSIYPPLPLRPTSRRLSELHSAFARPATCGTYALPLPLPSMSFVLEYVTPHRTLPVSSINSLVTSSRLTRSSTACSWQHCPFMHTSSHSLQPYRPMTAPPSASNSCTTTSTL